MANPALLNLIRTDRAKDATLGVIFADRLRSALTIEPLNCIPAGIYNLSIYASTKHGTDVVLLHDVPGFTYVEIHMGNKAVDTTACILPGERCFTSRDGTFMVYPSGPPFQAIRQWVRLNPGCKIEIRECFREKNELVK